MKRTLQVLAPFSLAFAAACSEGPVAPQPPLQLSPSLAFGTANACGTSTSVNLVAKQAAIGTVDTWNDDTDLHVAFNVTARLALRESFVQAVTSVAGIPLLTRGDPDLGAFDQSKGHRGRTRSFEYVVPLSQIGVVAGDNVVIAAITFVVDAAGARSEAWGAGAQIHPPQLPEYYNHVVQQCASPISVMTFSFLTAPGTGYRFIPSPYTEAGFTITANIGFCSADTPPVGTTSDFYAGSTGISNCYANGLNTLTRVGGGVFSLLSIDLAPFATSYGGGAPVTFVGHRADGSTVTAPLNAPATLAFSTYSFSGLGFDNLTSVTWTHVSPYHQFDNIMLR